MKEWGVWAVRSAQSVCGAAQAWCKNDGVEIELDTEQEAKKLAARYNSQTTPNICYFAKRRG